MAEREYTKAPVPNLNRAYKLLIGTATNTVQKRTSNSSFKSTVDLDTKLGSTTKSSSNLYLLEHHQITFNIKKDNNKDPNQAEITIYNLSDDTVNYINRGIRNNLAVALAVGYEGQELVMIFKGTIQWVSDTFDSVDRKTVLHCLDGGINISEARTSRSYPKGTKVKRVVADLVKDLGTTEGNIHIDNDQTLSSATAMCGNTSHYLEHICKSIDHNVSIQDGSVYVTPRSQMSNARSAYISPETGLIGSPEPFHNDIKPAKKVTKASKKAKKPTDGVKFKCQMNGAILPEKTIWLKSRDYDGPFKVVSVSHHGDKEGSEWVTEVECVSVSAIMTKEGK
ncbi:hypothetical protein MOO17_11670 [Escherichia coli]|uniref:phage protein n=1 Tax=Escherichia coli TaxID=562 RepID=UPI001FF4C767|nr:hypothetical protein [Escherichia coli]MCJ8478689.1 hypothetical protein [Escherichia coli]